MLSRVHHIGVVVDDLADAERLLRDVLGLTLARSLDIPGRPDRSRFYRCADVDIEVIEVLEPEARARRLGDARARIEHIAFEVADLGATSAQLGSYGVTVGEPLRLGTTLNVWTDPETSNGLLIQLVQTSPGSSSPMAAAREDDGSGRRAGGRLPGWRASG